VGIVLAEFVDDADVGVIERRGGLRFALEAGESVRGVGHVRREEFQRDEAVKGAVFGFIDDAHAAATEFFEDPVVRKGGAGERGIGHFEGSLVGGGGGVN
jgi:hypothetical protein